MDRLQPPRFDPPVDRPLRQAPLDQVTPCHHPVLALGELRDQPIRLPRPIFTTNVVANIDLSVHGRSVADSA
jgi:hypothetical protein